VVVSTSDPTQFFQGRVLAYDKSNGSMEIAITSINGTANFPSDIYEINLNPLDGTVGNTGALGETGPAGVTGSTGPTGPGIPPAGNTGDYLMKASGTNYDTTWSRPVVTTVGYINMIYATPSGGSVANLTLNSVTSSLPSNFSASVVSGSVQITNSLITNANYAASNTLLIPSGATVIYATAAGGADIATWSTNPTWALTNIATNKITISNAFLTFPGTFNSAAGILGAGATTGNGNGNNYTLAVVSLIFNPAIC